MIDALADLEPGPEPSGFILHMSRCGSTLVTQMLAAVPSISLVHDLLAWTSMRRLVTSCKANAAVLAASPATADAGLGARPSDDANPGSTRSEAALPVHSRQHSRAARARTHTRSAVAQAGVAVPAGRR